MSTEDSNEQLDSRITDEYTDPDKERPPVNERVKEMLGHNLVNSDYEGVER